MAKNQENRPPKGTGKRPPTSSKSGNNEGGSEKKSKKNRKSDGSSKMNAFLRGALKVLATLAIVFVLLAYSPGLLDIEPVCPETPPPPRPFTGVMAPSDIVPKVEKLFQHQIDGPESIAFYKGELYTGLQDGWIVRIKADGTMERVVNVGDHKCAEHQWKDERCGRPLGMRFGANGILYFIDTCFGLFKVEVRTGNVTTLYRSSDPVNGKRSLTPNDLAISASGDDIYFTDASTKFTLFNGIYAMLESAGHGRVLHYNVKTNTTRQLFDGIAFANGIQLSPNEDYLLIGESFRLRILKHHLTGTRQGETEVFLNLPGNPDNIRSNGKGGYWIPLVIGRGPTSQKSIMDRIQPYPLIRKVLARGIHVIQVSLKFIDALLPSDFVKTAAFKMAHMPSYLMFVKSYGLILETDGDGRILRSIHDPTGSLFGFISEVHEHGQYLYLGSPWNGYLGKLTL